jgi:tRNA threonylcarbamoyl adenosine modification protein YjeE
MADNSYWEKVYEVTARIPRGRVTSYGAIAEYLALGSARMVGWALNHVHSQQQIPAHRVVNRIGELSGRHMFATPTLMEERLISEGVKILDHKVQDFKRVFWHPGESHISNQTSSTTKIINSIIELDPTANWILENSKNHKILLFEGDLGAGKTTTIKAVCKALKVIDEPTSPTFSLINEYKTSDNKTVYHMDLYRLNSIEEALDVGIEEYLYSDNYVLIEWPDVIKPLLESSTTISIKRLSNGSREISIS